MSSVGGMLCGYFYAKAYKMMLNPWLCCSSRAASSVRVAVQLRSGSDAVAAFSRLAAAVASQLAHPGLPAAVRHWLQRVFADVCSPLQHVHRLVAPLRDDALPGASSSISPGCAHLLLEHESAASSSAVIRASCVSPGKMWKRKKNLAQRTARSRASAGGRRTPCSAVLAWLMAPPYGFSCMAQTCA